MATHALRRRRPRDRVLLEPGLPTTPTTPTAIHDAPLQARSKTAVPVRVPSSLGWCLLSAAGRPFAANGATCSLWSPLARALPRLAHVHPRPTTRPSWGGPLPKTKIPRPQTALALTPCCPTARLLLLPCPRPCICIPLSSPPPPQGSPLPRYPANSSMGEPRLPSLYASSSVVDPLCSQATTAQSRRTRKSPSTRPFRPPLSPAPPAACPPRPPTITMLLLLPTTPATPAMPAMPPTSPPNL
jgi:hypothetical protein